MCGIIGYVGWRDAKTIVVEAMRYLEYRGYDSTGIALVDQSQIKIYRAIGGVDNLTPSLAPDPFHGLAVGHTRWATHGAVCTENAHPHMDLSERIAIVHNGTVENVSDLKKRFLERGLRFRSDTDTEVMAYLLGDSYNRTNSLVEAFRELSHTVHGANAVVACCVGQPDLIVAMRVGHAGGLAIGMGDAEAFVSSDSQFIAKFANRIAFLEDGDIAAMRAGEVEILSTSGESMARRFWPVNAGFVAPSKQGYPHFMLKEILDQPFALDECLRGRIDAEASSVKLDEVKLTEQEWRQIDRIHLVGCGTSRYAALVIEYFLQEILDIPVATHYGSEFRYCTSRLGPNALVVAISQSGETADTLAALDRASQYGSRCLSIVNVEGSQAYRLANAGAITMRCGPEIAVACTKSFTAQVICGYLLGLKLAQIRNTLSSTCLNQLLRGLNELPSLAHQVLSDLHLFEDIATMLSQAHYVLYLGRWINYPIALEGALKLLELSYIPALAYPAGEIKHGPIALIDSQTPVVCVMPQDRVYDKMYVNFCEARSRFARIIAISSGKGKELQKEVESLIEIPITHELLSPILSVLPLQAFAYYSAVQRRCEVDQPRNLAKSVTVE